MMEKMGWAAGKGLGKKEDGMVAHVKVKKRADAQGGQGFICARKPRHGRRCRLSINP